MAGCLSTNLTGEGGQSKENEGDMAIPADKRADLVVIQAQFFGIGEIFFDAPTRSQSLDDLGEWRGGRTPDEVKCDDGGRITGSTDE